MISVRQHNRLLLPNQFQIVFNPYELGINHCHCTGWKPYCEFSCLTHSFTHLFMSAAKHFHYTSKWMHVNSLSNLRCLFMSHRHKSVYWQPINNCAVSVDERSRCSLFKTDFIPNITFRCAHRITSKNLIPNRATFVQTHTHTHRRTEYLLRIDRFAHFGIYSLRRMRVFDVKPVT